MNRQPLWRPTTRRRETLIRWAPVLVIVTASLALGLGEDELRQWGRYDREALESGELWRLVTAHLVHLGWGHLWLNLAALVMMAVLFDGLMSASDWVLASALAALSIDIGLYLFHPDVAWYVGLSGSLHGMMIVGALALRRSVASLGYILLLGIGSKLIWEQLAGPIPFSESTSGGPVLVEAHLYGTIGGLLTQLTRLIGQRRSQHRSAILSRSQTSGDNDGVNGA